MSWYFLPLLSPLALYLLACLALFQPGRRPGALCRSTAVVGLMVPAIALGSLVLLLLEGSGESPGLGAAHLGLAARLDAVSLALFLLTAFLAWVILRYAVRYSDGEARQGAFLGWLAATLATVQLLVLSAGLLPFALAWVGTSLCLHRLLLFYPERVRAKRAAAKKFIFARLSDAFLIGAFILLASDHGSGSIAAILENLKQAGDASILAAWLLALAAILKSAQFPTHTWLIEVMETPTPVSALLHAGVINAGGFLLIRFADLMILSPGALIGLALIGGFTALYGALVMLTQPAIKTALAWSTISQMGFMILECGLALFPLALLHLIAHSLYKAHAFLSSGGAVERVTASKRPGPVAVPSWSRVGEAFVLALLAYGAIGWAFGFAGKAPQALALGAILIFGVAYLIAQGLAQAAPQPLKWLTLGSALASSLAYFLLQQAAVALTHQVLPPTPAPGPLEWAVIVMAVGAFGAVALAQSLFPLWAYHPATAGLRVHLANGLYVNAILDRLLGNWSRADQSRKS